MSIIKAKYYYNGEKAGEVKFDSETTDPTTIDHKPEKWTTLEYNGVVIHNTRKKRKKVEVIEEPELPLEIPSSEEDLQDE